MACARRVATLALCFVSIGNLVVLAQSSPAMLKLDLKHPVGKASPMLYGLMTEETISRMTADFTPRWYATAPYTKRPNDGSWWKRVVRRQQWQSTRRPVQAMRSR